MYFSQESLQPYLEQRLISEQAHPTCPHLRIYNYTNHCQFARAWDEVTLRCRGLILDIERQAVVANPFPKFFNHGEVAVDIPVEEPRITEKMDGSLGILYWLNDLPWIATRGSFVSSQAQWATRWLRQHVEWEMLDRELTYLCEIIYADNRIVVEYPFEGLVLLAARETATGRDIIDIPGTEAFDRVVKNVLPCDLATLAQMDVPNSEGFVLHYPSTGLRLKIKFPEYVRLHKILTRLSVKGIWEHFAAGGTLPGLVDRVPDEFYIWVDTIASRFSRDFRAIEDVCRTTVAEVQELATRKEQAAVITTRANPGVCFAMLDSKDHGAVIWKLLQPKGAQTFRADIDA